MDTIYSQLYLYNSEFASAKRFEDNSSLYEIFFQQLMAILYEYNLFIESYKTAFECLQDPSNLLKIQIMLNLQMCSFLKERVNFWQNNLATMDKVAIIISNKYNRASFQGIILVYQQL